MSVDRLGLIERKIGTYRDLDAFQIIEDGRVMVALDVPGHRLPEEYVPADAYRGAVEALRTYGRHLSTCDLIERGAVNGGSCDCGWDALTTHGGQ